MKSREPLGEIVRRRIQTFFADLGSQHAPDLYRRVMQEVERVLIEEALSQAGGSKKIASELLGIHRNTLRLRIHKLKIDPDRIEQS